MNLDSWFIDTVTYAAPGGSLDSFGQPVRSAQTTILARVEAGSREMLGQQNQLVQITKIFAASVIPVDSQVWLPGDDVSDVSKCHRVLAVENASTKYGDFTLYKMLLN